MLEGSLVGGDGDGQPKGDCFPQIHDFTHTTKKLSSDDGSMQSDELGTLPCLPHSCTFTLEARSQLTFLSDCPSLIAVSATLLSTRASELAESCCMPKLLAGSKAPSFLKAIAVSVLYLFVLPWPYPGVTSHRTAPALLWNNNHLVTPSKWSRF